MKLRRLGNSDLMVSEVGLGTMSLGKEQLKASYMIDQAVDSGLNFLDTSDMYDSGLNEEIVGKSIQSKRQQLILSTKVGNVYDEEHNIWKWDATKKHIHKAIRDSLRRLRTDYIDLYQLHGGMIEDNIPETIEAFEELVKDGLIRNYGISSIRPNVIHEYIHNSNIVSVMMRYNLLDRRPEEFFSLFEEHNISLISRGSLAKGILTSKKKITDKVIENGYLSYTHADINQLLNVLETTTQIEQLSIPFTKYHNCIGNTLIGASNQEQLNQNIHAAQINLTDSEYRYLQSITKLEKYNSHRCTLKDSEQILGTYLPNFR